MDYHESIRYLEQLVPTLEHPTLRRIELFLEWQGAPQNSIPAFHVGGTNGKGSTVAMLDSVLRTSGMKVARFTGPHLLRWNERFHIDGQPITDSEFAVQATRLRAISEQFGRSYPEIGPLTWFEFLTALAFFYFSEQKVDVSVIEVGLGGRFDATNVIAKPLAVGITNVSLDHVHILGDTIEKIAFEKAGIVKSSRPVVTAATGAALEIIKARAQELNAPFFHCPEIESADKDLDTPVLAEQIFVFADDCRLAAYQRQNASVALQMLKSAGLLDNQLASQPLSKTVIQRGLENVYWPGRFQVLRSLGVILDGAHNLAGAKALRDSLDAQFPPNRMHFVFACYANKDGLAMLELLLKPGDRLYASESALSRAAFPKMELAKFAERMGIVASIHDSIELAFDEALRSRTNSEQVVATGSFATIKSIVTKLGWTSVEDGLAKNESQCI